MCTSALGCGKKTKIFFYNKAVKFVKTRLFEPSLHQAFPGFSPHSVFPFICARGTEVWIIISDLLTDGTRRQTAAISSSHLISPSIFFFHLASSNATEFQGSVKLGLIEGSMCFVCFSVGETNKETKTETLSNSREKNKKTVQVRSAEAAVIGGESRSARRRMECQGRSCNPWPHSWRIR